MKYIWEAPKFISIFYILNPYFLHVMMKLAVQVEGTCGVEHGLWRCLPQHCSNRKRGRIAFSAPSPAALPVIPYIPAVCLLDGNHSLDKISPCYMFRVSVFLVDSLLLQDLKRGLKEGVCSLHLSWMSLKTTVFGPRPHMDVEAPAVSFFWSCGVRL